MRWRNFAATWERQLLSVKELREALQTLDPGVRIVALMSQCYSSFVLIDGQGRVASPLTSSLRELAELGPQVAPLPGSGLIAASKRMRSWRRRCEVAYPRDGIAP
jgi:hypothetical protein